MNDGGAGVGGTKEPLARKPHGAGSVDYLAFETSIKPGMLCFRASQIWSHLDLWSQITNALD